MSSASEKHHSGWSEQPPPVLRWRIWPAVDRWYYGLAALLAWLVATYTIWDITDRWYLALPAGAVLFVAAWRFFLPVYYELNRDGVTHSVFGWRRCIPWNEIRRYEADRQGVWLSPFSDACPWDVFQGHYLPWGERGDEVLERIHYYLQHDPEE